MVVLSVFVRAVPLRGRRCPAGTRCSSPANGESGSWAITGRRAPGAAVACPSRSCSPRFRMTAARLARRGKPGGEEIGFATIRVDGRWPGWHARGCRGGRALVFAVLAGWRRMPSPSATASGSPNRLLCRDPVRHMSVISGSVELMNAQDVNCLSSRDRRNTCNGGVVNDDAGASAAGSALPGAGAFSGPADGGLTGGPSAVLGGYRVGRQLGGRGLGDRRVAAGRDPLVSPGWRGDPESCAGGVRPLPVFRRAGEHRGLARAEGGRARDRPPAGPRPVDDLA